jgi:uncharacterized damage-inducible protein DinB
MDDLTAIDAYLAGPTDLRLAIADMSDDQLVARPIPGKWSVLEVICHLADTDANIAHRLKRVLTEDRPTFDRVNPERLLGGLSYHDRNASEEVVLIDLTRRQVARILRAAPPQAWERTGIVNERGVRTVAQMLNGAIEHLGHHLRFIVEKRQALGLGESGTGAVDAISEPKFEFRTIKASR